MRTAVFVAAAVGIKVPLGQILCVALVACLGCGQITQKLSGRGVAGAGCGGEVELLRILLHRGGLLPDALQREVLDQPDRAPRVIARNMLAPDEGDDLSKTAPVQVNQTAAVFILLLGHPVKDCGAVGVFITQPFSIVTIDARIVLFRGDSERQNLLFAQVFETFAVERKSHGGTP